MRIDESVIKEVQLRTDIGALIGSYVSLHKRGRDFVGLCPFHGEKTPSFHVHPDRGFFKCFGCGAAGNAIGFYAKLENVPFPEAVRALAKRVGIEVQAQTPADARARSEREAIYQANELAAAFFHRMLRLSAEGAAARAYCERRGLSAESIESFKLGYAPPAWEGLVEELQGAGVDLELAEKAGLVRAGQRGYYDFYRGRLMIPTYATTGEVVAFGGRSLDASEPKYLNTAATPVHVKGRGLFALQVARRAIPESGALIVVEGYLDCIALHQAGFRNVVASLGTAFTNEQAAELRKYTERIFICFDADVAGSAATVKSIDVLSATGLSARVVRLPSGEDPDSYVRAGGAQAFAQALEAAVPWVEYKIDRALEGLRTKFVGAAAVAREAERLLRSLPREERDRWRVYVASRLGVSADDLRVSAFLADGRSFASRDARPAAKLTPIARQPRPIGVERDILMTLLDEPALVEEYAEVIPIQRFTDDAYRSVYEVLSARRRELKSVADVFAVFAGDRGELLANLRQADRSAAVRFVDTHARRAHLDRIVERLAREDDERRKRELDARIAELLCAGKQVPKEERDEYQRLVEKLDLVARRRIGAKI